MLPPTWRSYMFRAMGSQIVLWLDMADRAAASVMFTQAEALFAANEQVLSRFRPDSELSRLNSRSDRWTTTSDLLWQQIRLAVQMAAVTNGRFDPTLLNALERAGYDRSFEKLGQSGGNGHPTETKPLLGQWAAIEFDEARQAVRLPLGVRLDLGGIAKGDTAQQAVDLLQTAGPCLVDAGGDLVAGSAPNGYPGWLVAITAPAVEPKDWATIWLANAALATSGVDYRRWVQNGVVQHHLIDPLTGNPAYTDVLTATVWAESAAEAEAWAKATLIAGSDAGAEGLLEHNLAGLIFKENGRVLATPRMDHLLGSQPMAIMA